ncbi:MAG: hypothetical protein J2P30_18635 [Actinobacteria bacterium]|nr:hypothetical protein [Actinomycetota bacterium]
MSGTLTPTGDWTYGAAILSFAFPMLLFIAVAGALYVLYTKPHLVPGHRYNMQLRPTTATATPETAEPARPAMPAAVDTDTITGLEPPKNES